MGSVNFVVIVESARQLLKHGDESLKAFHIPSIVAVGAALGGLARLPIVTALINLKESSFFCFSTVTRYDPGQARFPCSGRIIATTCLSTPLVRFLARVALDRTLTPVYRSPHVSRRQQTRVVYALPSLSPCAW
jgi:hypothetical protein